jgi:hypothetical protein
MAVHPSKPDTVAIGGSDGAVWITTDAFATVLPTRVALPPPSSSTPCDPDKNFTCVVRSVLWLDVGGGTTLLVAAVRFHDVSLSSSSSSCHPPPPPPASCIHHTVCFPFFFLQPSPSSSCVHHKPARGKERESVCLSTSLLCISIACPLEIV